MRTFEDIYKSYCQWLYSKTSDEQLLYNNMLEIYGKQQTQVFLYEQILKKCYQKEDGLFYFIKFIVGDLEELGLPQPFRYNSLLREWTKIVQHNKRICIEAARGHGKCLAGNTKITLANEKTKELKDIQVGDKVLSLNENTLLLEPDKVLYHTFVGSKEEIELQTYSGKEISGSKDHAFLTQDGWKVLGDIKIGDYIAILQGTDISWDKVVKITNKDKVDMYDIQTVKNNNYVANNMIVHNSMFFSQVYPLYLLFLHKFRRILLISSNQPQAIRILNDVKNIVDSNEWLMTKKTKDRWSNESIGYNKGYIVAIGVGSEILGEHVDYIVLDDILRSDNKLSNQQIEDYVFLNLLPMLLNRDGTMVLVGTPKNAEDIFTTIQLRNKEAVDNDEPKPWVFKTYPAILDEDKKILLCPDRFSWDQIMAKKREMGNKEFAREYMLQFYSREQTLFPHSIIKPALEKGKDVVYQYKLPKTVPKDVIYFVSVDVARSGSASADYTVALVWAYNTTTNDRTLCYMWRKRGVKMSTQAKIIAEISRRFGNCPVVVETNSIGADMIDMLIDDYNLNIEEFTTSQKTKPEIITFLIQSFEKEKIVIPQGNEDTRKMFAPLLDELSRFCVTYTPAGNERYEGIGSKDDCVMSMAIGNKGTQLIGVPFALSNFGSDSANIGGKHETELFKIAQMYDLDNDEEFQGD